MRKIRRYDKLKTKKDYLSADPTHCSNRNCNRPLSTDSNARRNSCNACYIYFNRHNKPRPKTLCHPANTCGWCDVCGYRIILTIEEIEKKIKYVKCFGCRQKV